MYLKNIIIRAVELYHNYLSPLMLYKCRYYPTCSHYTIEAIKDRGIIKGVFIGAKRILRCNPLFKGGPDLYKK